LPVDLLDKMKERAMPSQPYDLLVIGAGPAGSGAALAAAEQGYRVALVERDKIGGTCLNYGCDPTKVLLHAAHLLHAARRAENYGLRIPSAEADWLEVQASLHKVLDQMRGGDDQQAREHLAKKGIHVRKGDAYFQSPHEIVIKDQTVYAERSIIASGSQAVVPQIKGLCDAGFITHKQAVYLPMLPRRLAILGGGSIAIQFAQMFHRFGVKVTLIEQDTTFLSKDDRELADMLCGLLSNEGIRMETRVELSSVCRDGEVKQLTIRCPGCPEEVLLVDEILVAIGLKPVLDTLNLAAAGVEVGENGVKVDQTLRTSISHIWAAGNVIGRYQFTHVAYDQGRLAAYNAFAGKPRPFDDRVIPWVIYTAPELAHVGKTEEQLRDAGIAYQVGRKPMSEVEQAVASRQTDGQVKLLIANDGTILGGHILSAHAGELIAPVILAMRAGLPAEMLATTMLPYLTMAESVRWAADTVFDR
jgi:pyruvate/2-oxoglutarate dehydrogenase complex dihydrolipoamide dehydrogenase (E3) component